MGKSTTMMMAVALTFGIGVSIASADVVDVLYKPSSLTRVFTDGTVGGQGSWPQIGYFGPTNPDSELWMKFEIPSHAEAPTIESAILTINIAAQYGTPYIAGVDAFYSADDSWTYSTISSAWSTAAQRTILGVSNNGGGTGEFSVDVTDWLTQPGEGQGQTLTIKLRRMGGGNRGCYLAYTGGGPYTPQLTITSVPEPATMGLLAIGGVAALTRRRK